jgi:hypothetical protein
VCGRKNWGAAACAAHYENVCDVRAGADKNPRTLKVWYSKSKYVLINKILISFLSLNKIMK